MPETTLKTAPPTPSAMIGQERRAIYRCMKGRTFANGKMHFSAPGGIQPPNTDAYVCATRDAASRFTGLVVYTKKEGALRFSALEAQGEPDARACLLPASP